MSPSEAKELRMGDGVVYWPTREDGSVVRVTDTFVFVQFKPTESAKACYPRDLMKL